MDFSVFYEVYYFKEDKICKSFKVHATLKMYKNEMSLIYKIICAICFDRLLMLLFDCDILEDNIRKK